MSRITTIPATKNKFTAMPLDAPAKRRVAAYARVSTDHEEQLTSYEAQVDYYTKYIKSRSDWDFIKVYTDDYVIIGISKENLVKSRVSALIPFSFFERASTNSYLKVKIQ